MDIGIDRLVEMIEERFGRRVSTVLLCLVVLAVGGYCVNLIYRFIVSPVTWLAINLLGHIQTGEIEITRWQVISWIISLIMWILLTMLFTLILKAVNKHFQRKTTDIVERATNLGKEVEVQFVELRQLESDVKRRISESQLLLEEIEHIAKENKIDLGTSNEG